MGVLLLLQQTSPTLLQKQKLLTMDSSWGTLGWRFVFLCVSAVLASLSSSGFVSASTQETIGLESNSGLLESDNITEIVTEEGSSLVYTEVMSTSRPCSGRSSR